MVEIDSNTWYHLFTEGLENDALKGTILFNSGMNGSVFFEKANLSIPEHKWQIYGVNSTTFVLRNQKGRYDGFMGTKYEPDEKAAGHTQAMLVRGNVTDDSAYWNIQPWADSDGTFSFTNAGNGTSWLLNRRDATLNMVQNTTASGKGQRISFKSIEAIDNTRYSTINLATLTMTAPMGTPTFLTPGLTSTSFTTSIDPTSTSARGPPNNTKESNRSGAGELSTGAKAGIGIAVALAAIIAIVVLGLLLWRRHQQKTLKYRQTSQTSIPAYEIDDAAVKYEMYHADATKYEMPVAQHQVPAELPNNMVYPSMR